MGNSRLGHPQQSRDVANAHLGMLQGAEYPYPGRIAEDLEHIRQVEENFVFRHKSPHSNNHILMDNIAIASIDFITRSAHGFLLNTTIEHIFNYNH
jgi:hypothetical protein